MEQEVRDILEEYAGDRVSALRKRWLTGSESGASERCYRHERYCLLPPEHRTLRRGMFGILESHRCGLCASLLTECSFKSTASLGKDAVIDGSRGFGGKTNREICGNQDFFAADFFFV